MRRGQNVAIEYRRAEGNTIVCRLCYRLGKCQCGRIGEGSRTCARCRREVGFTATAPCIGPSGTGRRNEIGGEHWDHLRTTNPIESVFATVRHRTVRTKGSLSSTSAKLTVFKLLCAASKTWRLKGTNQLPKVIAGIRFENGIEVIEVPANHAA